MAGPRMRQDTTLLSLSKTLHWMQSRNGIYALQLDKYRTQEKGSANQGRRDQETTGIGQTNGRKEYDRYGRVAEDQGAVHEREQ